MLSLLLGPCIAACVLTLAFRWRVPEDANGPALVRAHRAALAMFGGVVVLLALLWLDSDGPAIALTIAAALSLVAAAVLAVIAGRADSRLKLGRFVIVALLACVAFVVLGLNPPTVGSKEDGDLKDWGLIVPAMLALGVLPSAFSIVTARRLGNGLVVGSIALLLVPAGAWLLQTALTVQAWADVQPAYDTSSTAAIAPVPAPPAPAIAPVPAPPAPEPAASPTAPTPEAPVPAPIDLEAAFAAAEQYAGTINQAEWTPAFPGKPIAFVYVTEIFGPPVSCERPDPPPFEAGLPVRSAPRADAAIAATLHHGADLLSTTCLPGYSCALVFTRRGGFVEVYIKTAKTFAWLALGDRRLETLDEHLKSRSAYLTAHWNGSVFDAPGGAAQNVPPISEKPVSLLRVKTPGSLLRVGGERIVRAAPEDGAPALVRTDANVLLNRIASIAPSSHFDAAVVFEERGDWLRVLTRGDEPRDGWIRRGPGDVVAALAPERAERLQALLTPRFPPIRVKQVEQRGDRTWLSIDVLTRDDPWPWEEKLPPAPVHVAGWITAFSENGQPSVWFEPLCP